MTRSVMHKLLHCGVLLAMAGIMLWVLVQYHAAA